jgi:hypothetical protein
MDMEEAADRLRQLLADVEFDPERPDPAVVWAAFKRFAAERAAGAEGLQRLRQRCRRA